jgi:Zn-dependent protease with chaperone function
MRVALIVWQGRMAARPMFQFQRKPFQSAPSHRRAVIVAGTNGVGMRAAIIKIIVLCGRYAMLPVVAVAGAVIMGWFVALDRHPVAALIAFPIVLPIAIGAVVVGLGLLLPTRFRRDGVAVDEREAPGLWAMWNEFDRVSPRSRRVLRIDPQLNASIGEERRWFGLRREQLTMTVGAALLIALDERAVRAVVAHEVAHARLQHTTGGINLVEFEIAAENLFHYFDPEQTITGRVARLLLQALLDWVNTARLALSRANEFAADREAAERVSTDEMARALILLEAGHAQMKELIHEPLEKELLGAIRAPTPPLQRLVDQLDAFRKPERIAAAAAAEMSTADDPKSTHPAFATRLANLGFSTPPTVDVPQASAAAKLIAPAEMDELTARFNRDWKKGADQAVGIH